MAAFHSRLTQAPVAGDWARRAVDGPDAGCTVVFLGTVRAQSRGRAVGGLEYQAYPRMVEAELERIAAEVGAAHEVLRMAVEHSLGAVGVGQCSVVLAVASAHRAAAFAAAAAFMDALKERAPIWKKELYQDGSSWIGRGS
ncbi:MAG: molybdenum cofactor biosynthesis protein MoaE [Planctomycetes bacterium]|nr:molybdenum cofactor biosynthesis protein MoaE [Planctomycetota bacterium]MBL7007516.1 molybdenum cofactor biosynthesis protein MoaE [Planctomycetota bacterium]